MKLPVEKYCGKVMNFAHLRFEGKYTKEGRPNEKIFCDVYFSKCNSQQIV
jgi:hypothetical protein